MTTKSILGTILLSLLLMPAWAQKDMTSKIVNASYAGNNNTGWQGTTKGGQQMYGNAEFWNTRFDTYQTIEGLENGLYEVSVQGFYRPGYNDVQERDYAAYQKDSSSLQRNAVVYAIDGEHKGDITDVSHSSALQLIYTGTSNTLATHHFPNYGVQPGVLPVGDTYLPNTMESAAYCFRTGKYADNKVVVNVTGGKLTIGLKKFNLIYGDWVMYGHWQLKYYGKKSKKVKESGNALSKYEVTESPAVNAMLATYDVMPADPQNDSRGGTQMVFDEATNSILTTTYLPAINVESKQAFVNLMAEENGWQLFKALTAKAPNQLAEIFPTAMAVKDLLRMGIKFVCTAHYKEYSGRHTFTVDDLKKYLDEATLQSTSLGNTISPSPVTPIGEVVFMIEQMPTFPGGQAALMKYLSENIRYPAEAQKAGIQGHVIVTFVVTKEGRIVNPEVVKSVNPLLDNEAIRVISSMPQWIPGKQKDKAVNVKLTLPITFRL